MALLVVFAAHADTFFYSKSLDTDEAQHEQLAALFDSHMIEATQNNPYQLNVDACLKTGNHLSENFRRLTVTSNTCRTIFFTQQQFRELLNQRIFGSRRDEHESRTLIAAPSSFWLPGFLIGNIHYQTAYSNPESLVLIQCQNRSGLLHPNTVAPFDYW